MLIDHVRMGWRVVLFAVALAFGCTKPNPRSCADGTCTDPAFPFCDLNGEVEGQNDTCIGVTCTAGAFEACRGDLAITCNTEGTDFDLIQCDRGCEDDVGCRLCDPNETACTNGIVATCDANGAVTASEPCALGCFEDQPRCREIMPSNDLASLLDVSAAATDLDLSMGGTINTSDGTVRASDNTTVQANTVLLQAAQGGVPIRVLIVHSATLGNVNVVGTPALAIVSYGDVLVGGVLSLWENRTDDSIIVFPGAFSSSSCTGKFGGIEENFSSGNYFVASGTGGGGHATAGGNGGTVPGVVAGGSGGQASGNETLVPLRGGCGGASTGGGAIQIVSRTKIKLLDDALINANGQIGSAMLSSQFSFICGGGAGGGILLEAPAVEMGANTRLLANGGPAASTADTEPATSLTRAPSPGGSCAAFFCSKGGDGAAADGNATNGADLPLNTSAPTNSSFNASGGGGGLGYIRINTATGEFLKSSDTIESGHLTTGVATTR